MNGWTFSIALAFFPYKNLSNNSAILAQAWEKGLSQVDHMAGIKGMALIPSNASNQVKQLLLHLGR